MRGGAGGSVHPCNINITACASARVLQRQAGKEAECHPGRMKLGSGDGAPFNGALQVVDGSHRQRQEENTPRNEMHSVVHSNAVRSQGAYGSRPDFVTPPPEDTLGNGPISDPSCTAKSGQSPAGIRATVPSTMVGSRLTSTVGSCRAWLCPTPSPLLRIFPATHPAASFGSLLFSPRHQEQRTGVRARMREVCSVHWMLV
jgi:hypothetical protein